MFLKFYLYLFIPLPINLSVNVWLIYFSFALFIRHAFYLFLYLFNFFTIFFISQGIFQHLCCFPRIELESIYNLFLIPEYFVFQEKVSRSFGSSLHANAN